MYMWMDDYMTRAFEERKTGSDIWKKKRIHWATKLDTISRERQRQTEGGGSGRWMNVKNDDTHLINDGNSLSV